LQGAQPIYYFGDLDAAGLRIPFLASQRAVQAGLGPVRPHLQSYRALLAGGRPLSVVESSHHEFAAALETWCGWMEELSGEVLLLLRSGKRLPQEWIGSEFLLREGQ
jgi:hypothetical protein